MEEPAAASIATGGALRSSRRIAERASISVEATGVEKVTCDTASEETLDSSFDLNEYMKSIAATEKNVVRSPEEIEAMASLDITKRHHSRSNNLENSFIKAIGAVITKDGKQKWAMMLELVNNPNYRHGRRRDDSEKVPRAFVTCSGPITPVKLDVANAMCVDWQVRHKKLKVSKEGNPWYAPVTQKAEWRVFLARMAKYHGWRYTASNYENFEGSVNAVMAEIFEKRLNEFVSKMSNVCTLITTYKNNS